ncbi:hypothetical protein CDL12_28057 [Handroanthus impetiginosus]|uniref:DUF4218 domain-containing protein n=1 Tax=Handroanthus impetiginosus TaxID=429701 RepID=A0A2G9G2B2_9LAMI|nr:hypothetical protein CDL12_28057 [Handroanthus impetiginosus]
MEALYNSDRCTCLRGKKFTNDVEGSICEAFLCREISNFCSYYFEFHVHTLRTRVARNDDGSPDNSIPPTLSIFNQPCLSDQEYKLAILHFLLNCEEVKVFIK